MTRILACTLLAALALCSGTTRAQDAQNAQDPNDARAVQAAEAPKPGYDAALARELGADDYGMRSYVLVILRTGPTPVPAGEARDAMFQGHFANIKRLADAGTLALAGPLDGVDGWRGLFVLAVDDIEAARAAVATDPVVIHGEMVPEFHTYYGSAGLMSINALHARIAKKGI